MSNHQERLLVSPDIVKKPTVEGVELWHLETGRRTSVSQNIATILERFTSPRTCDEVIVASEREPEYVRHVVAELSKMEVLVRENDALPERPHRGFFNLPAIDFRDFYKKQERVDAVIVGIPFDGGTLTTPGARFGPEALRRNSWGIDWELTAGDVRVSGLYDRDAGEFLFQQASLYDIGNVGDVTMLQAIGRTESLHTITHTVGYITTKDTLPIFIGGDHSITAAVVAGMDQGQRLGIIQLDAHADYLGRTVSEMENVYHNNFVGFLLHHPNVEVVCQLGLRAPDYNPAHAKLKQHSLRETLAHIDRILEELPADIGYYVTVDLDVLDPVYMPNTGCFVPGGMNDRELVDLLVKIGRKLRVIGADFVEMTHDPLHDQRVGVMVTNLVLRFLSAALSPKGGAQR